MIVGFIYHCCDLYISPVVSYFAYIPTGEIFFNSCIFKLHIEIVTVIQWRRHCGRQGWYTEI